MNCFVLHREAVLKGYDEVSMLYPYLPSMSHWRAWEYTAYQRYHLDGRILDLGCGDGRFFQLLWPHAENAVGVDVNPEVAELGLRSGIYRKIHIAPAHQIPEPDASFDHVFANCSLEHMDHLDAVLSEIQRCLKPGCTLLCSVVTNRFLQWSLLPNLVAIAGFENAASRLQKDFLDYHHLVNPLSVDEWVIRFNQSGLSVEEHIPILPKHNSGIFLLMDHLWHIKRVDGGEMGDLVLPFFAAILHFPSAFRKVLDSLLQIETDWKDCSGAVFIARKPR